MRWSLKPKPDPDVVAHLQKELGVGKPIAALLVQRGVSTFAEAKKFFRPSLEDLHDPFLMQDMEAAVNRIELALKKEKISWSMGTMTLTEPQV